jgi:uncharacterized protein YegP (UPF0339 family)
MYFALYRSTNGQYYFNIKGGNNETLATSETYTRKQSALDTIDVIKRGAGGADIRDNT